MAVVILDGMRRERRCYTCRHKACNPPLAVPIRVFLTPDDPPEFVPKCPLHDTRMERVDNDHRSGGRVRV